MNKQQLAAKIWEAANSMRSKIEANEYKDVILGLIFYKFLSEKEITYMYTNAGMTENELSEIKEEDQEIVSYLQECIGYCIPYEHLYSTWVNNSRDFNVGDFNHAMDAFRGNISSKHKSLFEGIFDTMEAVIPKLGTSTGEQTKTLNSLIHLIDDIPMTDNGYDVLGYVYEFLIEKFASNAGKKAGEFYTPHEVSHLMSEIVAHHLADRDNVEIYDPTSGSGSLLITIGKQAEKYGINKDHIHYYAQELKENTYNLTRMNLIMNNIEADNITTRNADTLQEDWPTDGFEALCVDAVVSNPPYSQKWNAEEKKYDGRFDYGLAPKGKADYAFLLHDLYHLRQDGIMTIVLPHGVLFRGAEEGKIRKELLEHHHIKAIIGLPANMFYGTGIPTIVMVLQKQREESDVMIVDASKFYAKEGKNNKLRASDVKRIVDAVNNCEEIDKFSRIVSMDEICANDYNLNIPRYVDSSEEGESWDIYASMFGGIPKSELVSLNQYWNAWPSVYGDLFSDDGSPYVQLKTDDIRMAVLDNEDIREYRKSFTSAFEGFTDFLANLLIDGVETVDVVRAKEEIADDIYKRVSTVALMDKYESYQVLDDQWTTIGSDIEIIQTEGFKVINTVVPHMEVKNSKGKKTEVQKGWEHKILPFELIQEVVLADQVNAIERQKNCLSAIEAKLEELLDSLSEEDKESDAINDEGTGFVTANLNKAVKEIRKDIRKNGEPEEGTLEAVLLAADLLLADERSTKKIVKGLEEDLEECTIQIIKTMDENLAKALLRAYWITPLMESLDAMAAGKPSTFTKKIQAISDKYVTTYADVAQEIKSTEQELLGMLDDLTGNEYDMLGLAELKSLLGGE